MASSRLPPLPSEIWDIIIGMIPADGTDDYSRSTELLPLLLTSRRLYHLALPNFCRYIRIIGLCTHLRSSQGLIQMFETGPERKVFVRGVSIAGWADEARDTEPEGAPLRRRGLLARMVLLLTSLPNIQSTRIFGGGFPEEFHRWLLTCTMLKNIQLMDYMVDLAAQTEEYPDVPSEVIPKPSLLTIANIDKSYDNTQHAVLRTLWPFLSSNLTALDVDTEAFYVLGIHKKQYPALNALHVSHGPDSSFLNVAFTDSRVINFIEAHPTLEVISLDSLVVSDGQILVSPLPDSTRPHMPRLRHYQGPLRIATRLCRNTSSLETLTILELAGAQAKVDDHFTAICAPSLERLSMYGICWDDGTLMRLANHCANVETLHIRAARLPVSYTHWILELRDAEADVTFPKSWNAVKEEVISALKKLPRLRVFMFQRCLTEAEEEEEGRTAEPSLQDVVAEKQYLIQVMKSCPSLTMFYRPFTKWSWARDCRGGGLRRFPMTGLTILFGLV